MKIKTTPTATTFYLDSEPAKQDAEAMVRVLGGVGYKIKTIAKAKEVYKLTITIGYPLARSKKFDNVQYWQDFQ